MGLLAQTIHPHQLINFHTTVRDSCYQPHSADEGTLAERRGFTGQGQAPTRLRAPGGTEGRAVRFSAGHAPGRGLVTTRRPMVLCARAAIGPASRLLFKREVRRGCSVSRGGD